MPGAQRVTDQNLWRLRELTAQFDFSILWCAPVSWLTASIGQTCDGMVLVLTLPTKPGAWSPPNQRAVAQGASPFAGDRTRGAPFSCAARLVPESVNYGRINHKSVWDSGLKDSPSQFARMIPGHSCNAAPRFATPAADAAPHAPVNAIDQAAAARTRARTPAQAARCLTLAGDRFTLFSWWPPI
jgi:hypothetical protein